MKFGECEKMILDKLRRKYPKRDISGSSSVGRATAFQAVGREFEARLPLKLVC